jgi:hypothetical protein
VQECNYDNECLERVDVHPTIRESQNFIDANDAVLFGENVDSSSVRSAYGTHAAFWVR